jgi:membrane-associated phospholipid phosphatase
MTRERPRPRLVGELVVVALLLFAYDRIKSLASTRAGQSVEHGRQVLSAERAVGLDVEHSLNAALASHPAVSSAASWAYELLWATLPLLLLGWCWLRHPALYRSARNTLVLINLVGLVVFLTWPVAPPRLLPESGFVDSVADAGFGARHAGPLPADQYAAMPSLHLAWTVFFSLLAFAITRSWWLRIASLGLPLLTALVVLVTANHYLFDVLAGTLLAWLAAVVCQLLRPAVVRARSGAVHPIGRGVAALPEPGDGAVRVAHSASGSAGRP